MDMRLAKRIKQLYLEKSPNGKATEGYRSQAIYSSSVRRPGIKNHVTREAKDRQKSVSDVQYLVDMQHKVDSEYQVTAGSESLLRQQQAERIGGNSTGT